MPTGEKPSTAGPGFRKLRCSFQAHCYGTLQAFTIHSSTTFFPQLSHEPRSPR